MQCVRVLTASQMPLLAHRTLLLSRCIAMNLQALIVPLRSRQQILRALTVFSLSLHNVAAIIGLQPTISSTLLLQKLVQTEQTALRIPSLFLTLLTRVFSQSKTSFVKTRLTQRMMRLHNSVKKSFTLVVRRLLKAFISVDKTLRMHRPLRFLRVRQQYPDRYIHVLMNVL